MKVVNICGIPHTITKCGDPFKGGEEHFGEIDYKTAQIKLANDLSPEIETETLFHEMLHGIFFHIGHAELSENENFIDCLANALMQSFEVKIKEENEDEQEE